jgi:acyl-CoA synthetase (AMP-forming)/AMP-acid ligase II
MSSRQIESLGGRIRAVFAVGGGALAVESPLERSRWSDLDAAAYAIEAALQRAGIDPRNPIGWVARNRASAVASFAALVMHGRMVVPLRPRQTSATLPQEIAGQRLQAVIGDAEDWSDDAVVEAAAQAGSLGIAVSGTSSFEVRVVPRLDRVGPGPHREPMPGYVLERLTSGTTGAPKRIPVLESVLVPSLQSGGQSAASESPTLQLQKSPAILLKPFSHAGGLFGLLLALYQARPMVLIEKFSPSEWAQVVARHRPKSASLVPAMIQMILEAGIDPELLRSLRAVRAGTAPLDPQLQADFERRYGIPILIDYGAAEFIGGIAGWSLADHRQFGRTKRGSVGRPRPDVQLRITTPERDEPPPAGERGILHVKCDRFGPDWIRTTDLASIDPDGFLYLHGRSDDAINRGGFKILPEEVAAVLRRYPGVHDAAVLGKPDARLGQVPVAAIEMSPGIASPAVSLIEAFAREHLTAYMIPKEIHFVGALPRTASMKVSRPELKAMLGL